MAQTGNSLIDREVELRKKLCDAQYGEIYTEAEYDGSPVTVFIAPRGHYPAVDVWERTVPKSLSEVDSFAVSCPEVGESFSLTDFEDVAKLVNGFDAVIHDYKGIEMTDAKDMEELVQFREEHIDGHTQDQWDLLESLAEARVDDAYDSSAAVADPSNEQWDIALATKDLELPTSVAQDLVTFQNDIVRYEQMYKDRYGVTPGFYDVSPIEREDKLFGGLHASEYAEAYRKEHAPQEPEVSAEDKPDFVVNKKDVTSFPKISSYGVTIPCVASPYGWAKVYVNSSEIKELEDGHYAVTLDDCEHDISYTKGITRVRQSVSKDTILENVRFEIQTDVSSKRSGLDISINTPSDDHQFGS